MRHGKTLEERYFANATNIFTEREANRILKKGCKPGIQKVTAPLYERVKDKDSVTKMQYVDMHLWLVHDILMKGDKMGILWKCVSRFWIKKYWSLPRHCRCIIK